MTPSIKRSAPILAAALALASGAAQAKPLYITVPRGYSSQERPAVDVAFETRGPVELRVLKPESLEGFLKKQVNLRRAYTEPPTLHNPGQALARGLNAVQSPGYPLRQSLDLGLRAKVAPKLPEATGTAQRPLSRVAEGPAKVVGLPPGMKLFRTEWLNLDLGGSDREFDVPGFSAWSNGSSGFQERRVSLAPLPPGVYVLQLVQELVEGQVVLVVSDLTVQVKQTDGEVLVRVAGVDQRPKEGAEISVWLPSGERKAAKTDPKGEARVEAAEPRLIVTATLGEDTAIVDTDFYSTLAVAPDLFLYSDRPIYRPGDEARFRGVLRQPDGFLARLFSPKDRTVSVTLATDGGSPGTTCEVDEFGAFSGTLEVPEGLETGVLRLEAKVDERVHQSEARVQQYVKPTFYVEVLPAGETVTPGGVIAAKIRARRYAGGPEAGAAYEVFLYRTLLESPAWVDDAGMGGKGSAVTYGSASTTEGKLSVPERLYSSVAARQSEIDPADPWATAAKLDENGEAEISITVPPLAAGEERLPYRYTLTIRARDDQGSFANASQSYFLAECEVMGSLGPSAKVVKQNGEAAFGIKATTLGGKPYGATRGRAEFVLVDAKGEEEALSSEEFTTGDDGRFRLRAPTKELGAVIARVTLTDQKGKTWSGEASLLVVGEKGEAVAQVANLTLESLGGVLEPGDTAELVALFPDGWGAGLKNEGPVWVTLTGSGIFATDLLQVSGRTLVHRFYVEKRYGSAVYASLGYPTASGRWEERTVAFRIVPSERVLSVAVQPAELEARPLGTQTLDLFVTDSEGRGVAAQVSVGVVDKAIYALQQEFRPGIVEFFYPLGRNNVDSFYSVEFQGYGYGEQLARALWKLPRYGFSAVKPPTRQAKPREEDTAYWNPAVVTDEDGHARVTFEMPSNQTLWTVTAVAADASGRFGEGQAEFASRGGLSLVAALPQFLRAGDEATGSVRLSRGADGKPGMKLDVKAAVAGVLAKADVSEAVELPEQGEKLVSLRLKAEGPGQGELSLVAAGAERLADRRAIPVRPAEIEELVEVRAWGGGDLALQLADGARVESAELVLQPALVDVALSNVRELLEYPYGCLEQLVSTTIPNVAVYRTLEKVGALARLDPESKRLMAEARSRAEQGVQRILALAQKEGGFTWFSGYSTPSLPLTLIALDGLSYAAEAGLVEKDDPRLVTTARWLEAQGELPPEMEATRAYVLARLEGARQAPRVRALVEKTPPGDLYVVALAVLAAEHARIEKEPGVKEKVAQLVADSQQGYAKVADWRPAEGAFWQYPLRKVGMTAIVAHAASKSTFDLARVRRNLIEALSGQGGRLSTFDRSTALLHSLWLLERDAAELKSLPAPKAQAKGGGSIALKPRGTGLSGPVPAQATAVNVGGFEGVATLRAKVRTPIARLEPLSEGMVVERSYYVLRETGKQRLEEGAAVFQGEEVFVELTVNAHASADLQGRRSAYWVLADAVPAGFVPLIEDKEFRGPPHQLPLAHEALKRRALSPEKATFFFEEPAWWSDSPRVIGYVLRAQFPGTFSAPPATVEDMYDARVRGRTRAAVLRVETK